jgi:hypothetical protein
MSGMKRVQFNIARRTTCASDSRNKNNGIRINTGAQKAADKTADGSAYSAP